jgi:hypothetical protein
MTPRENMYQQKALFCNRIDAVLLRLLRPEPDVEQAIKNLLSVPGSNAEHEVSIAEPYRQALIAASQEANPELAEAYRQEAAALDTRLGFLVELLLGFRKRQGL